MSAPLPNNIQPSAPQPPQQLDQLVAHISDSTSALHPQILDTLHPGEIASLLESLPHPKRLQVWELVNRDLRGDVFVEMGEDARRHLLNGMPIDEVHALSERLALDDLADFIQSLPDDLSQSALGRVDRHNRPLLDSVLAYPEESAGGLMNLDAITVQKDTTLAGVSRYLRERGELPENTDRLIVIDRDAHYAGMLGLRHLLVCNPEDRVTDWMRTDIHPISVHTSTQQVARTFENLDLISAAVVDETGIVLGRITIDDVVDVIRSESDQSMMRMSGLRDEEDLFTPQIESAWRRAPWLGINLLTTLLVAWVISYFQATIESVVALAVLMPIVASMGGIAGSQTLTLIIRGQAMAQVSGNNLRFLIKREVVVALLNGILWASLVALLTYYAFGDYRIALSIGFALIVNLVCAALSGVYIPLILRAIHIDPALAGSMILTTVTDVIGFACFLGVASLLIGV